MQIICNENDLIINIADVVVENEYRNIIADGIVMLGDLKVFSINALPVDILPMKYCYTAEKGFFLNPNYVPSIEEKAKQLETELLNTKLAMAELVEQQQADNLNNQLALAELIESIMEGGTTA